MIAIVELEVYPEDTKGDLPTILNTVVGQGRWYIRGSIVGNGRSGSLVVLPADGESAAKLTAAKVAPKKGSLSGFVADECSEKAIRGWGISEQDFDKFWAPYEYRVVAAGKRTITKFTTMIEVVS